MLTLFTRKRTRQLRIVADSTATRADLQIRNLMDCPGLREAMGLDCVQPERQEVAA